MSYLLFLKMVERVIKMIGGGEIVFKTMGWDPD
jgi:hypothetical protein